MTLERLRETIEQMKKALFRHPEMQELIDTFEAFVELNKKRETTQGIEELQALFIELHAAQAKITKAIEKACTRYGVDPSELKSSKVEMPLESSKKNEKNLLRVKTRI